MNFFKLHVNIQEAALHAATWGCVGGILRGLWYLKDKVSDRKYRNSLRIYFISVPFLGGLFGAIMYFLIVAGLFIIAPSQAGPILSNQTANMTHPSAKTPGQPNPVQPSPAQNNRNSSHSPRYNSFCYISRLQLGMGYNDI